MSRAKSPKRPAQVFISYSAKDEKYRQRLERHLQILQHTGSLSAWHDRRISPGADWGGEVDKHLDNARLILLLISPEYLSSPYCYDVEMKRALDKQQEGSATVIPIILRPCDWWSAPFAKLQALPKDGKPVASWANTDAAFADVALAIQRVLESSQAKAEGEKPRREHYTFVITGSIDEGDSKKLEEIIKALQALTNDPTLTITKVEKGSVVLFLEGTKETADILTYLVDNGLLKDVCGCRVKGVGIVPDNLVTPSKARMNTSSEFLHLEDNASHLRRLVEQIRTPLGIIPFVGAGMSIPFGLPGWTEFLMTQAQTIGMGIRIRKTLASGMYEEAAEALEAAMRPFAFAGAIEDRYGDHCLNGTKFSGAVALLPRLSSGPVITTNFDRILETVFEGQNLRFEQVVYGAKPDMVNKALQQGRRRLLKLHGDWEERTDRILTKSQYERHYGSASSDGIDYSLPLPRLLKQVLTGRALLFLGCSLNQDRTVQVLQTVAREASEVGHFAILELPSTTAKRRLKTQFLSEHNIRPIWYPNGHHETIETVIQYLIEQKTATESGR